MLGEIDKLRYSKVFDGLTDHYYIKFILSSIGTIWAILTEIIYIEPTLLLACFIAMMLDLYTGIRNSKRRGIEVTSFGLRQLFPKIIEGGVVILFFTLMAFAFGRLEGDTWVITVFNQVQHIHYFAYFWIFWTEGKSILENLGGDKSRYIELWELVKDKLFKHIDNK